MLTLKKNNLRPQNMTPWKIPKHFSFPSLLQNIEYCFLVCILTRKRRSRPRRPPPAIHYVALMRIDDQDYSTYLPLIKKAWLLNYTQCGLDKQLKYPIILQYLIFFSSDDWKKDNKDMYDSKIPLKTRKVCCCCVNHSSHERLGKEVGHSGLFWL